MSANVPEVIRHSVVLGVLGALIGYQSTRDLRNMLVGVLAAYGVDVPG